MRILQLYNKVPYPPKDGGSIAVSNLNKGLSLNNCEIKMLCFNTTKHFVNIKNTKEKYNLDTETININTNLSPFKALINLCFSKLPYNAERFISKEFEKKLINIIKSEHFDIVQIEGLYMMSYIDIIRKHSKAKISFRAHNIEHEIWEQTYKQQKNIIKKLYLKILYHRLKKLEISFINKYDFLIPITERDSQNFKNFGNNKPTHVSPTGINTTKYTQTNFDDSENISIYSLGSLDWTPNIEGLIWFIKNIWSEMQKNNPQIKFNIAGRNPSTSLIQYFKENNITFFGEIDNAKEFMNSNKIMIVPLLSGSGMRIKIIEAMASGNIVISTSKGAEGIKAIDNKEILIANTPGEFIQKIKKLSENKFNKNKISIAAREFISENFDNFAISKSLKNFYLKQLKI